MISQVFFLATRKMVKGGPGHACSCDRSGLARRVDLACGYLAGGLCWTGCLLFCVDLAFTALAVSRSAGERGARRLLNEEDGHPFRGVGYSLFRRRPAACLCWAAGVTYGVVFLRGWDESARLCEGTERIAVWRLSDELPGA